MAGHSHWANIAHKKGRIDKVRGKLFAKLSKAIIVAAQHGGGDPAGNLALRYAIDRAKKGDMPNDTIDRAIKKGTGELAAAHYDSILYEGYGPHGVAVLCEILTDNRNRTAGEVRRIFEINGGNLGSTGCVAWMFERKGLFIIPATQISEDGLMELAIEAGASDVQPMGNSFEVTCPMEMYQQVAEAFELAKLKPEVAELTMIASNTVDLDIQSGRAVLKLMEALEENEDVQNVTANFNIPDDVMAQLAG